MVFIFDIGGGSMEFVWFDFSGLVEGDGIFFGLSIMCLIVVWILFLFGVVNLVEWYGGCDVLVDIY